ncbi:MAG TPA: flagellar basal body rod C-terminal domain-containing protein, partial [Oligoflexia bacterium]|nr:flagellar basal body rod C-terminal domain-containing protein [Oligoflexia bacterium]
AGYSARGTTGIDFFAPLTTKRGAAEFLRISDAVAADANVIATGLLPDSPGDNRLIQQISNLQHAKTMGGGVATFDDFYNATVTELATASHRNKHVLEHQTNIVTQLEKVRESISGVSLDEETTNLVQYQHAFDAAAKVIKVADEILETVLNMRA